MDTHGGKSSTIAHIDPITGDIKALPSRSSSPTHAAPEITAIGKGAEGERAGENADPAEANKGGWFAYLRTRNFYLVLLLGYGITGLPVSLEG